MPSDGSLSVGRIAKDIEIRLLLEAPLPTATTWTFPATLCADVTPIRRRLRAGQGKIWVCDHFRDLGGEVVSLL